MPKLRVCHVSLGLNTGGQEIILAELIRCSDPHRFEHSVLSLTPAGKMAERIENAGGKVICLDDRGGIRPGLVLRLRQLFKAKCYDIVHTHDDRPLAYAAPAAWLSGVRRRVHTHHHGQLKQLTTFERLLMRTGARFVDDFVCVSHDSARYVRESAIAPAVVQVTWNGVDLSRFSTGQDLADGPAVCVARLAPQKGHATLLKATADLVKSLPEFRLDIAGDGPCRSELEQLRDDLGLQAHVRFLGEVHDIAQLLRKASMFILPSYSEGLSLTVIEAMASGLPVLATAVGGNREALEHGVSGLLVAPYDHAALAMAIQKVATNKALARQLGEAARLRTVQFFDLRKMVQAYEAIYESAGAK